MGAKATDQYCCHERVNSIHADVGGGLRKQNDLGGE